MFHLLEKSVPNEVAARLKHSLNLEAPVTAEQPRDPKFGELALPVAFGLARQMKKAPRAIAEEMVTHLQGIPGVGALEIAGNGYINVRLDRAAYLQHLLQAPSANSQAAEGKIIVEHTNINPNKAAHIGHLRNAILGDTFVRMLRAAGQTVEVENYIDNTGVQVADVVAGFHFLEKKSLAEVAALTQQPKFDHYCWDLYAGISSLYKESEEAKKWRTQVLRAMEDGHGEMAELGHLVADAIVQCHLATMSRLDIHYDVLPRESEILSLKFWAAAFELLKERQAIYLETEGKNKGCWVMPASAFRDNVETVEEGEAEDSKVIVRSNGIVTYVGKDIAYQLWKFGLLGQDFFYRPLENWPGVYVSTATPTSPPSAGSNTARKRGDTSTVPGSNPAVQGGEPISFGAGSTVYNVIDTRQSYLQDVVVAGLKALGFQKEAERSIHFNYEMVALSPRTCAELDIPISEEDQKKAYIEVSGRKGLGVKADDLLDKLIHSAFTEVSSRNAEAPEAGRRETATKIAIGALRYFMLKFTRNTVIAFDLQEALSFTGETGPYVQYAAVRANKILEKLDSMGVPAPAPQDVAAEFLEDEGLWQLVLAISKLESALDRSVTSGEPSHMARYAFGLAQEFSGFYSNYNVAAEANPARQKFLHWLTGYFAQQLKRSTEILGIPVPKYM